MELKVYRKYYSDKSTIGELYINGQFFCFTLEDFDRLRKGLPKVKSETAIPAGKYKVIINKSERFSKLAGKDIFMPLILDVPQFSGVRIHNGSKPEHTDGCILVGLSKDNDFIGMSKVAFQKLMDRFATVPNEAHTIEIIHYEKLK